MAPSSDSLPSAARTRILASTGSDGSPISAGASVQDRRRMPPRTSVVPRTRMCACKPTATGRAQSFRVALRPAPATMCHPGRGLCGACGVDGMWIPPGSGRSRSTLEVALESGEEPHGGGGVGRDPALVELDKGRDVEMVPALAALAPRDEETCLLEDGDVLHDGAAVEVREVLAEIAGRARRVAQK